jgi:hypothetical protein
MLKQIKESLKLGFDVLKPEEGVIKPTELEHCTS